MASRSLTMSKQHRIYYHLNALHYANLQDVIEEICDVLLQYLIAQHRMQLACLFGSLNKQTRVLLRQFVFSHKIPHMGDPAPPYYLNTPALFVSWADRMSWLNVHCRCCQRPALHRKQICNLLVGGIHTILVCTSCLRKNRRYPYYLCCNLKKKYAPLIIDGTTIHLANNSIPLTQLPSDLQGITELVKHVKIHVSCISHQKWTDFTETLPISRVLPFHVRKAKKSFNVNEFFFVFAAYTTTGTSQRIFQASLHDTHSRRLKAGMPTADLFHFLLGNMRTVQKRMNLLRLLIEWGRECKGNLCQPVAHTRKGGFVVRRPPVPKCLHDYAIGGYACLVYCTSCGHKTLPQIKRRAIRTPQN